MKLLLLATALSFGLCGACFAQTSAAPNKQTHEEPATSGNGPGGAVTEISNQCHTEGASLICTTPKNAPASESKSSDKQ